MPAILSAYGDNSIIDKSFPAPCPSDDQRIYDQLAAELQLNPKAAVAPTLPEACGAQARITGREILSSFVVDEPDNGMDQDLPGAPEAVDPQRAARWMGGLTGKTSTGFRHMYFGGWQLWHPLATFQIPPRAIGYAPERAALMAAKARELIHKGGMEGAWGFRVLGWAIHYLQDLAQPFHAVQIPDLEMVPWYTIMRWPPSEGFGDLVRETTRTIANYHWAFEHYTLFRITTPTGQGAGRDDRSPYLDCIENPEGGEAVRAVLADDPRRDQLGSDPRFLAERTARASVQIAPQVGDAVIRFFGIGLKARVVDIPAGLGEPNYIDLAVQPDLYEERDNLTRITCRALGDATMATRLVIDWALK
jgi:hypothetical protein